MNVVPPKRVAYLDLMREIEDFFYMEADLLDERNYDAWLDLLTDNILYWMPMRKNVSFDDRDEETTAEDDIAWFHDDKETLTKRVRQIQTGVHWADEPISRVSHLITNIRLSKPIIALDEGKKLTTKCRFIVYRNRLETETDLLVGRREDTLTRVNGKLMLNYIHKRCCAINTARSGTIHQIFFISIFFSRNF